MNPVGGSSIFGLIWEIWEKRETAIRGVRPAQNLSTEPAWGNTKPMDSAFGSETTGLGSGTGPALGSGVDKSLTFDASKKGSSC